MSHPTIFNTPKIFVVNVGVNASHGTLRSPIFDDLTFKFIPIPERYKNYNLPTYKEICPQDTLKYIPEKYHKWKVHNDPEFSTFTYGDYLIKRDEHPNPRVANLKYARRGDWIFFFARLIKWLDGEFINDAGFYFIGYFEIEKILKDVTELPNNHLLNEIKDNAHIIRTTRGGIQPDGYWLFKGNENSKPFKRAVPFNRDFVQYIGMRDANGDAWDWSWGTELQIIGSYTRSCRMIENLDKINLFWHWVNNHA